MAKALFMLQASTCVRWEMCSTVIGVLFKVLCAVVVSIPCASLCMNYIYNTHQFRANCADVCVSFYDMGVWCKMRVLEVVVLSIYLNRERRMNLCFASNY